MAVRKESGVFAVLGEAFVVAGLIVAMAYAVPLGFELLQL